MKLYSRSQLIIVGIAGAAVALAFALGFGLARLPSRDAALAVTTAESVKLAESPAPAEAQKPYDAAELITADTQGAQYSSDERENIDVYERLNAGVVNITTEVVAINWFYEPVPQEGGTGSGSIIDERGYILTNNHVIKSASKIFVNLADGGRFQAEVVGVDSENDLAVIKFDPPKGVKLTVIPYGDSDRLKVGQKVLAIGNPFGLDRTLTRGIVSALGRPIVSQDEDTRREIVIQDMIQTDASINPGNSGGPLLNAKGEMIGVNTMIYSPSQGSVGIGFAVPVNTARRVVPELIKEGRVRRGWIEISMVQLFPELVDYMKQGGYPTPITEGLLISKTTKGGNADRAGMKGGERTVRYGRSTFNVGGDIISSINGVEVATITDLYSALETTKPDDRVEVEFYRNGKKMKAQVQLVDRGKAGIND
jgi:S1-C subfamily serine protease